MSFIVCLSDTIARDHPQDHQSDYALGSQVIALQLQDGTARLLDLDSKFHVVSKTGCLILFETLKSGHQNAIDRLISDYAIDRSLAEMDVENFLDRLEQEKLIYRTTTAVSAQSQKQWNLRSILKFVLLLLLRCIGLLPGSIPVVLEIKIWALLTLAYISVRLWNWSKTVEFWRAQLSSSSLRIEQNNFEANNINQNNVNQNKTDQNSGNPSSIAEYIHTVNQRIRSITAYHPLHIACKERSLCGWWLMRSVGIPAKLHLGVNLFPLSSHAWCDVGGEIVADDPERCTAFTPVYCYDL